MYQKPITSLADVQIKEALTLLSCATVSVSTGLLDVLPQINHALHLRLLLRPQWLLLRTGEEEEGAAGGRGG